jgi:soluble cytochrome b562
MKIRLLSTIIAFLIAFCGVNTSVFSAAHESKEDHDHTELGEQMETISKSFRTLRRQAKDPAKNAASAKLAGKMLAAAKAGLEFEPAWKADQPAGEQADFVAGFQKEMKVFVGLLTDLEKAFKDGDNDKANAIVGKLRDHQKKSHKSFKAPDED